MEVGIACVQYCQKFQLQTLYLIILLLQTNKKTYIIYFLCLLYSAADFGNKVLIFSFEGDLLIIKSK